MRRSREVGWRSVNYVRVDVRRRPAAAHAVGVSRRITTEIPIRLSAAARLAAAGVPVIVLDQPTGD
jgi:hypothetical protein